MNKEEKQEIIETVLGGMAVAGKAYPAPLPPELAAWHCYTKDGGHSILCLLAKDYIAEGGNIDNLLPMPVKAVLRCGYELQDEWVVVNLPYSPDFGLEVEDFDEEF